jgi:quercetin dioxygenase-like cupin family protein
VKKKTGYLVGSVGLACFALGIAVHAAVAGPPTDKRLVIAVGDLPVVVELPGETLRGLEGQQYGFESLSFGVSDTAPGSGAPPHHHQAEEAHVVLSGKLEYEIAGQRIAATAPFIARIPAGAEHSFRNVGSEPVTVVGVFPRASISEIDPQQ